MTLQDNFGEVCYRDPKIMNGRNIDLGGSNEGILFGKVAYCHRVHENSGCDAKDVKEGESYWKGAVWREDCVFGFSGFPELDDLEIAKVGEQAYFE